MPTSVDDITRWFHTHTAETHSHMIVATDTFDYGDYPIFVERGQDAASIVASTRAAPMSKVMEVYSYDLPFSAQVAEHRAYFL